jgi:Putative Ig domain
MSNPSTLAELIIARAQRGGKVFIMADVQVSIQITVNPASAPLTVDASGVPSTATVGVPFSGAIKASGGTAPYTFTETGGALPDGLTLNADGTITGTPTTPGAFTVNIDVKDSAA